MDHVLAAVENLISALINHSVFPKGGSVCISCWTMACQLAFLLLPDDLAVLQLLYLALIHFGSR